MMLFVSLEYNKGSSIHWLLMALNNRRRNQRLEWFNSRIVTPVQHSTIYLTSVVLEHGAFHPGKKTTCY